MDKVKKEPGEIPKDEDMIRFEGIINKQEKTFKNRQVTTIKLREQIEKWRKKTISDSDKVKLVDEIRTLKDDLSFKKSKKTEIETTIATKRTKYEGLCHDDVHKVNQQTDQFVEKQQRSLDELEKDIKKLATKLDALMKQHAEYLAQERLITDLEKLQTCAEKELQYIEVYLRDQRKQFEKMIKSKLEAQEFTLAWTANIQSIEAKLSVLSNSNNINVLPSEIRINSTDPGEINIPPVSTDVMSTEKKREIIDGAGVKRKAEMIIDSGKVGVKISVTKNKNQASSSSPSNTYVGASPPKISRQDGKSSRKSSDRSDKSSRGEKKSRRRERRSSGSHRNNKSHESRSKRERIIPSTSPVVQTNSNKSSISSSANSSSSKNSLFKSPFSEVKAGSAEMEIVNKLTTVLENFQNQGNGELATKILEVLMFLQDPQTNNKNNNNNDIKNEISQHFIYNIIHRSPSYNSDSDFSKKFIGALSLLNHFKLLIKKVKVFMDEEVEDEEIIEESILINTHPEVEKHLFPLLLRKKRIRVSFSHLVFACREEITGLKSLYKHEKKKLVLSLFWNILRKFHWIPASHFNEDQDIGMRSGNTNSMTSQEYLLLNNRHYLADEFNDVGYYKRAHDLLKENYELLTQKFHVENVQNLLKNKTLLSSVLKSMGLYSESLTLASEVYHFRVSECGLTGIGTMEALNNISCILLAQGNFTEAHSKLTFAYSTLKQQLGEEDECTINTYHNLACLLLERGSKEDLEEARKMFVKIHEITFKKSRTSSKGNGSNSLDSKSDEAFTDDLLWVKSCLGEVYLTQGNAEVAMKSILPVYLRHYDLHGKNNPITLESLRNLARANSCLGNLNEALDFLNDVLNMQTDLMGKDNPETLSTLYEKSCILVKQKEYQEALDIFHQVLESQKTLFGSEHYKTLKTQENIKATQKLLASSSSTTN